MLTEKQQKILEIAMEKKEYLDYVKLCIETKTCPECGNEIEVDYDNILMCYVCDKEYQ